MTWSDENPCWKSICHTSVEDARVSLTHWHGEEGIADIDRALAYLDQEGAEKKTLRKVLQIRRRKIEKELNTCG